MGKDDCNNFLSATQYKRVQVLAETGQRAKAAEQQREGSPYRTSSAMEGTKTIQMWGPCCLWQNHDNDNDTDVILLSAARP